ncbi:MAG TPA: c-type cytochrome domain-containing protein, partial [Pirellulaceae bacterium]|nr:c-type cytochrome domain-containing protein [Pirellulaceae bacterium]
FSKHIAPILVTKCSRCHINDSKGKFSLATFGALMKGNPDGIVVRPGKSSGSRLVDLITSGDMPRAGAKVTPAELTAISKWIDEGAKFDGPDEKTPLLRLAAASGVRPTKPDEPKLTVVPATGRESVAFSKDIGPVLVANCFSCHATQQAQGQFQMGRFVDMLRGGQSGNPWVPGNPEDSLIIKKLKGTAGARMPQPKNAAPLEPEVIAKFEKWIAEGARFDGADPAQAVTLLVALVRAKSATHDELSAERMTAAKKMWSLTNPGDKPTLRESKNLLVVSNLPDGVLADVVEVAEQQAAAVAKQFHAPADKPLVKGRITLFAIATRYDYSEFGRMVEQRTLPKDSVGHWKYNVVDAYGTIIVPGDVHDYSMAGIAAQEIASVYVASLSGAPPAWFVDGTGRVMAFRIDGKSPRVRQWNDRLHQLAVDGKLAGFNGQNLSMEDNEIAAYGFVKELMSSAAKYAQLINALRGGEMFDIAFPRIYGGAPQVMAASWAKTVK